MILNEKQIEMYNNCIFLNEGLFKSREERRQEKERKRQERERLNKFRYEAFEQAKSNALKLCPSLQSTGKTAITSFNKPKMPYQKIDTDVRKINEWMYGTNSDRNLVGPEYGNYTLYFLVLTVPHPYADSIKGYKKDENGENDGYSNNLENYLDYIYNSLEKKLGNKNFKIDVFREHENGEKEFYVYGINFEEEYRKIFDNLKKKEI